MAENPVKLMQLHCSAPLAFKSMDGEEELGKPFEYRVVGLAKQRIADLDGLLATPASVSVMLPDDTLRHFHGVVCSVGYEGQVGKLFAYRLVLRPWLWLLTRRADLRIFQNKSVPDILRAVLGAFSGDYRLELSGNLPPREYCVQYRESDFNFVTRLMEQEGIYYHFEHEAGKHTMVLTNASGKHTALPGFASVPYRHGLLKERVSDAITEWHTQLGVESTKASLSDFDFTQPGLSLATSKTEGRGHGSPELEVYDYPGLYQKKDEGDRYAKLRAEGLQSPRTQIRGAGAVRTLATGRRFKVAEAPAHADGEYIVASTRMRLLIAAFDSDTDDTQIACEFTAYDANHTHRPPRTAPKPTVAGPQTAIVVGKAGEEIWTDKHGRVKVQFHWDRQGQKNENSSCWVRVSQPWAGQGFGMISLPRIGHEVVVDFLEGDPDQPLITGRVYNGTNTPPYALPDHATVSTLKSRSSKSGAAANANELRFEDKKGSEYVWFQAEKDYYQYVKHDSHTVVDNDVTRTIKKNLAEEIKENVQLLVGKDRKEQIKGKAHLTVDGDRAIAVKGKQDTKVSNDLVFESGAVISLKSGADSHAKVGANLGIDAAANVHIKGGANVVIEAGAMLTLKCGGSSIVLGPTLSITGSMVLINSGGAPGAGSGASPKSPAAPEAPQPPEVPADPIAS